ncbi:Protein-glutamate methylesterase/protein-glutamine glutaminase [Streptomyces rimosus subsp. rimosus]
MAGTTWVGGRLLARGAPALLGRTPADRLAAAERRAADLASRNRLARELHDSVGHALSAVTLQAGAARRVLDRDPEFVRQALTAIEETTRDAVAELDTAWACCARTATAGPPRPRRRWTAWTDCWPAPAPPGSGSPRTSTTAAGGCRRWSHGRRTGWCRQGCSNALRHAGAVPVGLRITVGAEELTITMENPVKEAVRTWRGTSRRAGRVRRRARPARHRRARPPAGRRGAGHRPGRRVAADRTPPAGSGPVSGADGTAPSEGRGPLRIVLADDERMVRTALRAILGAEPDMEVVGEAATGAEAVPMIRELRPDVVLMDVRMPEIDGIRATEQVLAGMAEPPRILVVTTFENDAYVYDALRAQRTASCSSGPGWRTLYRRYG